MNDLQQQICMLKQDGYKNAANALEDFASGKAEYEYIKEFVSRGGFDNPTIRKQFRCLWTAYCLRYDLAPDTDTYDSLLLALWFQLDEKVTQDWSYFDSFDFYMGAFLA